MPTIQTIIEEYKRKNPADRLYLFLQYPGLRPVFDQIDNDEFNTQFKSLSNSQRRHITPQVFLPCGFADLHNFIKSIFGNNINTKKRKVDKADPFVEERSSQCDQYLQQ